MENSTAPDFAKFEDAKKYFSNVESAWKAKVDGQTDTNRKLRDLKLDLEELRNNGDLSMNETIIPVRVIDQSIALEQPQYANYLASTKRAAIFRCKSNPDYDEKALERDFTDAVRYPGWQDDYLKCTDGAQLHGWDAVEVEYTPSRPGAFNVVHIGHENLLFPLDARKLEACPGIFVRLYVNAAKLHKFAKDYGFSHEQISKIIGIEDKAAMLKGENFVIYKFYFKKDGVVNLGWLSERCDGWLKSPTPYWNGIYEVKSGLSLEGPQEEFVKVHAKTYPVKMLTYKLNEKAEISSQYGRANMDDATQEALTNLWTAGVNGAVKSANVYASPSQPIDASSKPSVLDLELEQDRVYSAPLNFFSPPGTDPQLIGLANAVLGNQQATQGQVNFAANNRKDSKKTATEVESAERLQQNLNIINTLQYSTWLRAVYMSCWAICKSAALTGQIDFLRVQTQGQMGPVMANDKAALNYKYVVIPAGDVDVVERNEKVQSIGMIWSYAQMFPQLQAILLQELIQLLFIEDAPKMLQAVQQTMNPQEKEGVRQILDTLVNAPPEEVGSMVQEMAPDLQNLINNLATQPAQ